MPNLRAFITNIRVEGETFTETESGGIRDTLTFSCGGQEFVMKVADGQAQVLVENVPEQAKAATVEAVERICWLLALATQSHVVCYGHEYPDGSGQGLRSTVNRASQHGDALIDPMDGQAIRIFVEKTFSQFAALESTRSLRVAIDYLLQAASPSLPLECKLVFLFVLLENLKHSYGHSKAIPYLGEAFRAANNAKASKIGFRAMLTLMFSDVGMAPTLQPVVKLRNDIVHTGLSGKPPSEQKTSYDEISDLIREYLARLLGFKGNINISPTRGSTKAI